MYRGGLSLASLKGGVVAIFRLLLLVCCLGLVALVHGEHPVQVERAFIAGRYFEALKYFAHIPRRRWRSAAVVQAFESAWALGLRRKALLLSADLENSFPEYLKQHPEFLLKRAIVEFQEGDFSAAKATVDRVLKSEAAPKHQGEAASLAAEIYRQEGDYTLAYAFAKKALELLPVEGSDEANLLAGLANYQRGELALAAEHLEKISPQYDQVGRALRLLIEIALKQADYQRATLWLEEGMELVESFASDSWIDYARMQVAIASQDSAAVQELLKSVESKFPESDPWRVLLEADAEQHFWVLSTSEDTSGNNDSGQ